MANPFDIPSWQKQQKTYDALIWHRIDGISLSQFKLIANPLFTNMSSSLLTDQEHTFSNRFSNLPEDWYSSVYFIFIYFINHISIAAHLIKAVK